MLRKTTPATRARLMLDLQRTVGNAAARELLTEPPRSGPTVHGGGPTVSLHGDTTADYEGGVSKWTPKSMKRAKTCTECPDDDPCLHAVGTFTVTYNANMTITMPDVPDGLTACQERRVRAFLRDVLGPHEREHARRFRTYNGTTTHPINFTGCGTSALQDTCRRSTTTKRRSGTPMPTRSRRRSIRSTSQWTSTATTNCASDTANQERAIVPITNRAHRSGDQPMAEFQCE